MGMPSLTVFLTSETIGNICHQRQTILRNTHCRPNHRVEIVSGHLYFSLKWEPLAGNRDVRSQSSATPILVRLNWLVNRLYSSSTYETLTLLIDHKYTAKVR